ncbi:flagellar biosynthesis protein FlhF [Bacillus sp. FJAT-29790]|uniref:flagellar biosynthesis protein FlhF n=1 Tax=Bacillus sp. FJAT-29790 TaxID=1895002 RepID=UPI001C21F6B7|nr:flagellar biosynthesis protein FlhF [Bacillus sp. FJAT-29790]MBU8877849.1 flagellar biosynthesis protein FlhF [Bacillus sp. FJAT-29790]
MKVKKYVASSMAEAMKQIRAELGSDAVILNSREIQTGGFLGLFKKRNIEVVAAADQQQKRHSFPITKQKQIVQAVASPAQPKAGSLKQESSAAGQKPAEDLLKEMNELKTLIKNMSPDNSGLAISYPAPLQIMNKLLMNQELDVSVQEELLSSILEKWYVEGANASIDTVYSWLEKELSDRISHIPFGGISFKKKYINVVGPTGVGKTTTLAKMAAECVINHKKKVAFITTDTYRIAAIDQLKTYAKILNVPMEVCYTIEDFNNAARTFENYDLVLVDTAGRNFRNKQYVDDLKKVIDFENDIETYLVLSLTAKQRDMEDIYDQFSIIEIDKLIFTKADETSSYGAMYNLISKYNKGVAYMTNGQNVPDDMIAAKPSLIAKTIIGVE